MKYQAKNTALSQTTDCIVLGIYENNEFSKSFNEIDQLTQDYLNDLVKSGELTGKLAQIVLLRDLQGLSAKRVLIVGCGKKGELTERQYKQIIQAVLNTLKETNMREVVSYLTEIELKDRDLYWNIRFAIETIEHTNYQFDHFKSQKTEASVLESFIFNADCEQAQQAISHANAISSGIKAARDIANMPPNICNPAYLAKQAKNLAENSTALSLKVVDEEEMSKLGMNAYLAVSKGSENRAYMSVLTFNNAPDKNAKPIVLVGKGLTFDAGGISLKPAADMDEMKYDMCGAASVFGTMKAIAELNLPLNVIGVLAGCENLPDGNAYRPGDILTTMNGLTVEVLNTDAEGRLVLCDSLTYVERFEPELVIDVATLTGACVVALGQHNSGLVSTDNALANALLQAATETTDKAWRLPLSEEYQEQLKSPFADLANIGGRWGGAITAGAFLSNFTKKYRWAHLDIAGTAWLQGANKGATGRPVSLLTQFLINQVK
ncbi:TPA: leucyl aminopeptidase [Haemophilus influenzae]|uniref:Probable cytosol aminopeptidase n=1 Tax=Haemophilus influenzae TaxID=727 RepID=A0A2S9RPQ9_HAEIF|nr:leucyl aminopeptidase [Haemophilus influenzae]PRI46761.1 Cytosol aminopeptidase [Haemophilus influenzae]PRI87962.1 Cytosol aminopeptidase [Haemophilus influenzae]PRI90879.1 Cytosol aminopeptidase [Haemophilus influenzae]PRJ61028.1 Cytosol aminopeptidase [Haemophilus influenzae]PRJ87414.1 Cytosol aminopeptidase [Haemophilus influenzae]